jgi:hypothetical protein
MESKSERALTIKRLLWETYRQLVTQSTASVSSIKRTPFENAVTTTFDKASPVLIQGLTTETLTMARTRFILEWFKNYGDRYPFRLFDHQQLLKAGLFEAYDQWLFGEIENKARYEQWKIEKVESFSKMESFLFNRVFKMNRYPYLF